MNDISKVIVTPDAQRGNYSRIVELLAQMMGLDVKSFVNAYKVMPFVCKMAAYLNTGLSQYTLSPRKGVDPLIPGSQLLDQNDFFALTALGLRVGRAAFASNVYSNHGNYPIMTYPDPNFFNGSGTSAGSEAASLQTLVNGTVAVNVNNDSQIDALVAQELFFNPMATYTSSPLAYPQFGGSEAEKGYKEITPNLILDASADNAFVVNLGTGAKLNIDGSISTLTTDSGVRNILYIFASGWKIKNLAGKGVNPLACV